MYDTWIEQKRKLVVLFFGFFDSKLTLEEKKRSHRSYKTTSTHNRQKEDKRVRAKWTYLAAIHDIWLKLEKSAHMMLKEKKREKQKKQDAYA